MDELKPCPFCGGRVEMHEGDECAYVQCLQVSGHRAIFIDGDNAAALEAADMWNTRTPDLAAEVLRLRAEVERLTEALTPSCYTKAAYMGEIHCDCPTENWKHFVPWTSIKEIMAMIRARAALKAKGTE